MEKWEHLHPIILYQCAELCAKNKIKLYIKCK